MGRNVFFFPVAVLVFPTHTAPPGAQVVVIGSAAGDLALKYIEPRAVPYPPAV